MVLRFHPNRPIITSQFAQSAALYKTGDEGRLAPRSWDLGYELEVDGIVAAYLDSADVKTGFAVHFCAFHSAVCGRQSRLQTRYNSLATLDVP